MKSFASNLINTIFKRVSARPAAARRRATLAFEPLEMRAVLSTIMPAPTTAADDVVVDGGVITGENYDSSRAGGGGGGAGKVQMQDSHISLLAGRTSHHSGGVNAVLGDGSVRFLRDSVPTLGTWAAASAGAGTHGVGGGGGAGKVSMNDTSFNVPGGADDGVADIIVGSGVGSAGHVKVFDGTSRGQVGSFFAFEGAFHGGVNVAASAGAGTHGVGGGGGAGKVSMRDFSFSEPSDRFDDIIVGAGVGPAGHVKVFDGTRGAELASFLAFDGFHGGVNVSAFSPYGGYLGGIRVAAGDVGDSAGLDDNGHGTHVAGTIGSGGRPAAGVGTPTGSVRFVVDGVSATGLSKSLWINQDLERVIDDLASDVAGQHASRHRG